MMSVSVESSSRRAEWLRPELVAPWWEVILVGAAFIGPFIWTSAWAALHGSNHKYVTLLLSDNHLLWNGVIESGLLAIFLLFLCWRGWTPADFKIAPGWISSVQGFGLLITVQIASSVTVIGLLLLLFLGQTRFSSFMPFLASQAPHLKLHSLDVSWAVMVPAMVLNAYFEELICMGYLFTQIAAKQGPLAALLLTVLVRMSCHTYQDQVHLLGIGVVFLLFGVWYWRTQNLWPLIFAHALLDLFSTGVVKLIFGR